MYQSSVAARHKVEGLLSLLQEGNDLADELTSAHHHWQPTNGSAEVCSSRQNGKGSSAHLPSSQPNAQEEQQRRRHPPSLTRNNGAAVTPSPLEAIDLNNNSSMNVNELRKAIRIARLSANPLPYFTLGKGPREHTAPSCRTEPPHHQQQQEEQERRRRAHQVPPPLPSLSHFPLTNPPSPIAKSSLNNSENW